jgi:uncharacterized protein
MSKLPVTPRSEAEPVRVWALTEGRTGDDAQVVALARALGLPYRVVALQGNTVPRLILDRIVDFLGLDRTPKRLPADARDAWPDLVIAIGGASVSTLRRLVKASHGVTRSVQLGRPVASLRTFDLVVTTPQYGLPDAPNVVAVALPFGTPRLEPALTALWAERLAAMPRPWTALLVGGDSGSYRLREAAVDQIVEIAQRAASGGGSILATTSRRTPAFVARALRERLPAPSFVYAFEPGDRSNPFSAFLALADRFVVTGESASMIADAVKTRRSVEIVALERTTLSRVLVGLHRTATRFAGGLVRALTLRGLWVPPRDLGAFHEALFEVGVTGSRAEAWRYEDQRVLARVRALADPIVAPSPELWSRPTAGRPD